MNKPARRIQSGLASAGELPYENLKGQAATVGLRAGGYVSDPAAFWAYYDQNRAVINRYWGHVDAARVLGDLTSPAKNPYAAGLLGAALGAGALYLYQQAKENGNR